MTSYSDSTRKQSPPLSKSPGFEPYNLFNHGWSHFRDGYQTVVDDNFTKCFETKSFIPKKWTFGNSILFGLKEILCDFIIFPIKFSIFVLNNVLFALLFFILKLLPLSKNLRLTLQKKFIVFYGWGWLMSLGVFPTFHGTFPKPQPNYIYVANHTCLIDYMLLCTQRACGSVGQRTPGFLGWIMKHTIDCCDNIWFDRSMQFEKDNLTRRIKTRIQDPAKANLMIFPEGVCVNNEYTLMFKRGAFEIGATVVPVGIKYSKRVTDPYYNTRKVGFFMYCINMMRSLGVHADVFFLDPVNQNEGESVNDFAKRVQLLVSERTGLTATNFDGYMKHYPPSRTYMRRIQEKTTDEVCEGLRIASDFSHTISPPLPLPSPTTDEEKQRREIAIDVSKWMVDKTELNAQEAKKKKGKKQKKVE
ncbi:putative Glycerol-3-phosphate acyltransferase 9 [Blattamonas nauphoetae]|uniref:Glycerol-3-phosphate acyltransferase 9 n=1 Tax=Blattamonas nauphoetae TaxID=2049346 RepID=A0ABQ9YER3_9EUKA|nr:putative Glycerol-3-phosphate acyltransferase 9 [Blattamonas nauphoetae]